VKMSTVALSPVTPELPSPMATSANLCDPCDEMDPGLDHDQNQDQDLDQGSSVRQGKPPPLHTGADWKVVLHLPEIEKWLRASGERVTQLSHSVSQDREGRHVDAHLLQLKDICEDISDHVEQIHALLETEFSLKLLSYSVNIIVDIRSVQLLWHQLRVSVLVLKERLLQGLQDSNGNFTRQTDILQAFNQHSQTRLEDLTEVDDCGALTIRCSQDYFSLDCGITAFELSDYSPSDETCEENQLKEGPNEPQDSEFHQENTDKRDASGQEDKLSSTLHCSNERVKRSHSTEASPTHQSQPKRAALVSDPDQGESRGADPKTTHQTRVEVSHSPSSSMETPDRDGFWLELDEVYSQNKVSETVEWFNIGLFLSVHGSSQLSPHRQHWFGSEEFLALPAQLRKTEILTMNLETLAKSMPLVSNTQSPGNYLKRQLLPPRFSPSSSSDAAPSLDESLESGRISDLHSEEEAGTVDRGVTAPPTDGAGRSALVQKLLHRMESLVQKLDGLISWLQDSLDSTENWTQPRQDLESLKAYLSTHLNSIKPIIYYIFNNCTVKSLSSDSYLFIPLYRLSSSALRDILHMVSVQWEQLQRQIRRQHGWMLRALRCIQARLFYQLDQSQQTISVSTVPSTNQKTAQSSEVQRAALEQMAVRLNSLQYPSPASRRSSAQTRANSLQELEAEYQELSDWLMDMDAMVTDSHQLMMSEEQRHHLFKVKRLNNKLLSVHSGPAPAHLSSCPSLLSAAPAGPSGRCILSPLTESLLEQLESRIKELKSWLRDTELLIFNSCLRNNKEPEEQLQSFKRREVKERGRGVLFQ
uniref:A kinase (PRKA) anchor protein 6 n=1 Tax=Periophthalmus magnuspinnatus TaxID=409849 RepID=A0A3B4BEM5_9GOBI